MVDLSTSNVIKEEINTDGSGDLKLGAAIRIIDLLEQCLTELKRIKL